MKIEIYEEITDQVKRTRNNLVFAGETRQLEEWELRKIDALAEVIEELEYKLSDLYPPRNK